MVFITTILVLVGMLLAMFVIVAACMQSARLSKIEEQFNDPAYRSEMMSHYR